VGENRVFQNCVCEHVSSTSHGTWLKYNRYDLLIHNLLDCGNLRSASAYIARAQKAFPDDATFDEHDAKLSQKVHSYFEAKGEDINNADVEEYPDRGLVRRERYPWSSHEPDRSSEECLQILNAEIAGIAPRFEVRISELPLMSTKVPEDCSGAEVQYVKQLGLFAKEDIAPGETVLEEKSLLTAISRLHDSYCDACSIKLPTMQGATGGTHTDQSISCDECEEVFFCSAECHDLAQNCYHPSLCGVSVDQSKVPAREAADSLYTLLLVRTLALAQTQEMHPLELKEIRYIWGDYIGHDLDQIWRADAEGQAIDGFGAVPQTLPFSFKSTVLTPLHMLEKMDVNIYTEHRYDTWVLNTIYAKLRGTASARQGLDLRPEIGAVHPMWCLANHSCDPNVAWEWQGTMKLWTRKELVNWSGRDPTKKPGIKKGEEIFSHYCDVRLPVKERREWAAGALGGECTCQRCVWEEIDELRHGAITQ
jgi:hypothetical protein